MIQEIRVDRTFDFQNAWLKVLFTALWPFGDCSFPTILNIFLPSFSQS